MTIKSVRAQIILGAIVLDVFQLPNGDYGFSATGIAEILNLSSDKRVRQILTSKALKPKTAILLGFGKNEDFELKLSKVSTSDSGNINFLPLDLLMLIVGYEAWKNDNEAAQAILEASLAEALERRADTAFGIIRTEEERNAKVKFRMEVSKQTRRTITDSIKEYIARHPELSENYSRFVYSNCTDCLNLIVLGAKAKQVKVELDLKPTGLLRDVIPLNSLRELEALERIASRLIEVEDVEPLEACKQALKLMHAKTLGYQ